MKADPSGITESGRYLPNTAVALHLARLFGHPTIKVLMDVLQSASLRREIDTLPGYDGSVTGRLIADLRPHSGTHCA